MLVYVSLAGADRAAAERWSAFRGIAFRFEREERLSHPDPARRRPITFGYVEERHAEKMRAWAREDSRVGIGPLLVAEV